MDAPKLVPPDHRFKVVAPGGLSRDQVREEWRDCASHLAAKGCTFFQFDENDEQTVCLVSGWKKRPDLPDIPYVDRSELVIDQARAQ